MASDSRIASRYAKQSKLDTIFNDMLCIKDALSNRDFKLFVKSPIIHADKKQSVFAQILGNSISEISLNFFNILARKGRESFLPEMVESFIHQYKKHNKITEVKLTTATAMGESALSSIKSALEKSNVTDQTVEINAVVDPTLIGGFVIEMDDKLYDASVVHKLEQVRKNFISK